MQWRGRQRSQNVEDRRGQSSGSNWTRGMGGLGRSTGRSPMGLPFPIGLPQSRGARVGAGGGFSLVLILIIFLLLSRGGGLSSLLGGGDVPDSRPVQPGQVAVAENANEKDRREMLEVVLYETEQCWQKLFSQIGKQYHPCTLVLFRDQVRSSCGGATAQSGPFYCSADRKVYIDLSFYDQLEHELGAKGDFAMAYVLAHEVGHHVQQELGLLDQVHELQRRARTETERNDLTIRLELQADYLAGVWAHYAEQKGLLDPGDIEEAITATQKVGDDHLQRQTQGYVVPDSFTHGTSEQRSRWFRKGYRAGDLRDWDTFQADRASDLSAFLPQASSELTEHVPQAQPFGGMLATAMREPGSLFTLALAAAASYSPL